MYSKIAISACRVFHDLRQISSGVTLNDAMTNLIWVTFGNVVGVALAYRFAFLGESTR